MSYIYNVSRVNPIQLHLSMNMNTDFESQFISVNNFRLVCLLPIVAYTYICTFVFDLRLGRYEKSKMFLYLLINIIYGLFNTTELQNILFKTLFYPENI
jgi:hypothetical protein